MHLTLVTAVAVLAHATQSFAAPILATYEIQELAVRSDGKENWKKAMQGIAGAIPDAALKVPVKSNILSVVQKAVAAAKGDSLPSSNTHHAPRPPAAQPAPLTEESSSFQHPPPVPFKKPEPKPETQPETQPITKYIANQTAGAFRRPGKRDVVPELEARNLEIDELD